VSFKLKILLLRVKYSLLKVVDKYLLPLSINVSVSCYLFDNTKES